MWNDPDVSQQTQSKTMTLLLACAASTHVFIFYPHIPSPVHKFMQGPCIIHGKMTVWRTRVRDSGILKGVCEPRKD